MSDAEPPPGAGDEAPPDAGGGDDPGAVSEEKKLIPRKDPDLFLPIYVMTGIFAAIFIIVPFFFRKGPNKGIVRCSIMIAAFSMWLFWVTVYIAQMNPLMGPRVKNETLAWIAYAWGKTPSPPAQPPDETTPASPELPEISEDVMSEHSKII